MTSLTSQRINELDDAMKQCFPNIDWKNTLTNVNAKTICVPECPNLVKKNVYRGSVGEACSGDRQNIIGMQAEAEFINRITKLKLGGVLIAGLRTSDLEKTSRVQNEDFVLQDGDWDAIFIHQKRGIFVVEIKGTGPDSSCEQQLQKAEAQLDKLTENITELYRKFFKNTECFRVPNITGLVCFPFHQFDSLSEVETYYDVIDSSILASPKKLKTFFESFGQTPHEEVYFERLVAELVCCRIEFFFHSQAYNAMQIAQWIQTQDYQPRNQKYSNGYQGIIQPLSGNDSIQRIILTSDQQQIVHCTDHCITIRGAPGSGKTLIVMLRALAAAKQDKPGSRVLVFVNEALIPKYEKYFHEESQLIVRKPIVLLTDRMKAARPDDDVFMDETPIEESKIIEIKERLSAKGNTTVVFTGFDKPGRADAEFRLYENELSKCDVNFTLNTVLRGTREIFNEWQSYFHRGMQIGHGIIGAPVDRLSLNSFEDIQRELLQKLSELLQDPDQLVVANSSHANKMKLTELHLVVITSHNEDALKLRRFFNSNGIEAGSLMEQVNHTKALLAVDIFQNTPSYEWPIVFVVHRTGDPKITQEQVISIAASRCIARLTLIEYQNINDQQLTDGVSHSNINDAANGGTEATCSSITEQNKNVPSDNRLDSIDVNKRLGFYERIQKLVPKPEAIVEPEYALQLAQQNANCPKLWISLEIGKTENDGRLFFDKFVRAANAAGHNLATSSTHSLHYSDVHEAVSYIKKIKDLATFDYLIALDYSRYKKNVGANILPYNVLLKEFKQRPRPFTVFKPDAKNCLPGHRDHQLYMKDLVDFTFWHMHKNEKPV